jgi:DNA mismatch endonuclease, patch repair protein
MARVRGKDTGIERLVRSALHRRGLRFRKHPKDLPGRPDVVFRPAKVAVFIDGDFWHGYRFEEWEDELSGFWRRKIRGNLERDERKFAELRDQGWAVVRLWQHEVEQDLDGCIEKIVGLVETRKAGGGSPGS